MPSERRRRTKRRGQKRNGENCCFCTSSSFTSFGLWYAHWCHDRNPSNVDEKEVGNRWTFMPWPWSIIPITPLQPGKEGWRLERLPERRKQTEGSKNMEAGGGSFDDQAKVWWFGGSRLSQRLEVTLLHLTKLHQVSSAPLSDVIGLVIIEVSRTFSFLSEIRIDCILIVDKWLTGRFLCSRVS